MFILWSLLHTLNDLMYIKHIRELPLYAKCLNLRHYQNRNSKTYLLSKCKRKKRWLRDCVRGWWADGVSQKTAWTICTVTSPTSWQASLKSSLPKMAVSIRYLNKRSFLATFHSSFLEIIRCSKWYIPGELDITIPSPPLGPALQLTI